MKFRIYLAQRFYNKTNIDILNIYFFLFQEKCNYLIYITNIYYIQVISKTKYILLYSQKIKCLNIKFQKKKIQNKIKKFIVLGFFYFNNKVLIQIYKQYAQFLQIRNILLLVMRISKLMSLVLFIFKIIPIKKFIQDYKILI